MDQQTTTTAQATDLLTGISEQELTVEQRLKLAELQLAKEQLEVRKNELAAVEAANARANLAALQAAGANGAKPAKGLKKDGTPRAKPVLKNKDLDAKAAAAGLRDWKDIALYCDGTNRHPGKNFGAVLHEPIAFDGHTAKVPQGIVPEKYAAHYGTSATRNCPTCSQYSKDLLDAEGKRTTLAAAAANGGVAYIRMGSGELKQVHVGAQQKSQ